MPVTASRGTRELYCYIIDSGDAPFFCEDFFLVDWVSVDFFDEDFFFSVADFFPFLCSVLCAGFTSSPFLHPVTVMLANTNIAAIKIRIFFMAPPSVQSTKILTKKSSEHYHKTLAFVNKTKNCSDPGYKKCYNQ